MAGKTRWTTRRTKYERNRQRLGLKPWHLATTGEVDDGVGCAGCEVHWEGRPKVRVVLALHECPVHSRLESPRGE